MEQLRLQGLGHRERENQQGENRQLGEDEKPHRQIARQMPYRAGAGTQRQLK
ncbi:hypothetical protein FQZ97_940890 [compost metagenome]